MHANAPDSRARHGPGFVTLPGWHATLRSGSSSSTTRAPILELVRGYLEREGFEVPTAADGPAGLAAVRADQPDVVVLDVMLPGLDGIEVCRRLRTFSDAYVLMLTARGEEIDRIMGLTVGPTTIL